MLNILRCIIIHFFVWNDPCDMPHLHFDRFGVLFIFVWLINGFFGHGTGIISWRKYLDLIIVDVVTDVITFKDDTNELSTIRALPWSSTISEDCWLVLLDESLVLVIVGWKYFKMLFWFFSRIGNFIDVSFEFFE